MVQRDSDNNEGGHLQEPNERAKEPAKKVKPEENKKQAQAQGGKKKKAAQEAKKKEEQEKGAKKKEEQEKEAKKKEEQEKEAKKKEEQEKEAKKKEEQEKEAQKTKEEQELERETKKKKAQQAKARAQEAQKRNEKKKERRERRKKKKVQEEARRLGNGSSDSKENTGKDAFTEGPASSSQAEELSQPLSINSTAISDSSTLSLADSKLAKTSSAIGKSQDMDPVSDAEGPSKTMDTKTLPPDSEGRMKLDHGQPTAGDIDSYHHIRKKGPWSPGNYKNDVADGMQIPPSPICILERDAQHDRIVAELLSVPNARVAILGTSGIGKTTLACSAAEDPQIMDAYPRRLFLSFEGCYTPDRAYTNLATTFQIPANRRSTHQQILSQVLKYLKQVKTLFIIDSFETFWEPSSNRRASEELLNHLTVLQELAVLVTLRGSQPPGNDRWLEIGPLQALTKTASKTLLSIITRQDYTESNSEYIQKILNAVAGIPLAVMLAGSLLRDGSEIPQSLWNRWTGESTRANRVLTKVNSDVRYISRNSSISGPRMELPSAIAILQIGLSMGVDEKWLDDLLKLLPDARDHIRILRATLDTSTPPQLLPPGGDFYLNSMSRDGELVRKLFGAYNPGLERGYYDDGGKVIAMPGDSIRSIEASLDPESPGLPNTPIGPSITLQDDNTDREGGPLLHICTKFTRPNLASNFIRENKTRIENCLRDTTYEGAYLVQAGFNPDLLGVNVFHQEILITLEEECDLYSFGRPLLPLLRSYSVRVAAPDQEVWFAQAEEGNDSPPSPLIIRTPNDTPISDTNISIKGSEAQDSGDRMNAGETTQLQSTGRESELTGDGDEHELQVAEAQRNGASSEDEKKPNRRKLLLPLMSFVRIVVDDATDHPSYEFVLKPDIMIELSSNVNGDDPPDSLVLLWPWCRFQVNNLFISTEPTNMHSLRRVLAEVNASPQNTIVHGMPSQQHAIMDGLKQKRENQRSRKADLSLTKVPGVTLGMTKTDITASEPSLRRWTVKSNQSLQNDSMTVRSSYEYSSAYETIDDLVYAETFEPGPHALLESYSEIEHRRLRVKFVAFWEMDTGSARGSKRSKLSPSSFLRRINSREKGAEPMILANFLHEMSFDIDLGKITAEKAGATNPNLLDQVESLRERASHKFPTKVLEIKTPSGEEVDLEVCVARAIRGRIAGKNGRSFEAGSSSRSAGAASGVVV